MALRFQTTLRWVTEANFHVPPDAMFAAVREGEEAVYRGAASGVGA